MNKPNEMTNADIRTELRMLTALDPRDELTKEQWRKAYERWSELTAEKEARKRASAW